jgi:hypothetical protein
MIELIRKTVYRKQEALVNRFHAPMRVLARRAVRVWFNRGRLDQLLWESFPGFAGCDMIYAIDTRGIQVSSNVCEAAIDRAAYRQDLSDRPYHITIPHLNNAAFQGAFLCEVYVSRLTQCPCVTILRGVTVGTAILGFIAADLDVHTLSSLPYSDGESVSRLDPDEGPLLQH